MSDGLIQAETSGVLTEPAIPTTVSVRGCDWDQAKVALATRASSGLPADFVSGDARDAALEPADTVLLVDVLHYFETAAQDRLLDRAVTLVRPGGRLVVREASAGRGWRSSVTRAVEAVARLVRLNRGERIVLRDVVREIVPALEARGLACVVEPCWQGTPFSNVLLVAARAAPPT